MIDTLTTIILFQFKIHNIQFHQNIFILTFSLVYKMSINDFMYSYFNIICTLNGVLLYPCPFHPLPDFLHFDWYPRINNFE